ncbi:quinone oxidoreductase family protein [Streptomyces sp. 4N509B]|uniref:quinone oxidoreductase family protein n=1 Tax=Streptomyces sp. 4N509B TaxID=3457413 RepID=UPI003FD2DBFE
MQAIVVTHHGGPEVLRHVHDHPDPEPGPGQALVDVAAIGVNFVDVAHRRGVFPVPAPFVPGVEAAGTVTALGPAVDAGVDGARPDVAVGDRVAWAMAGGVTDAHGAYAQRAVVAADRLVHVPDELPLDVAATVLMQGMTAHYLTHDTHAVGPGDTVLVHAAAGGLGRLVTQYAVARGARVIATASTPEKRDVARAAGAHEAVAYDDMRLAVARLTGGEGVSVVYDGVGAPTLEASLASLRRRGLLVLLGAAGGPVTALDTGRLLHAGSVFLTRPGLPHHVADREELTRRAGAVWRDLAAGTLRVTAHSRPLAEARLAHEDLQARRTTGKLLLVP